MLAILHSIKNQKDNKIVVCLIAGYSVTMLTGFPLHISATALLAIILFSYSLKNGEKKWH